MTPLQTYHEAVAAFKREFLMRMLEAHNGNRSRTARDIGLQRTYLLRLLRDFGLTPSRLRGSDGEKG